jgi:hypothetical protein
LNKIREALDAADIPYDDAQPQTRWLVYASPIQELHIWVCGADLEAARNIVRDVYTRLDHDGSDTDEDATVGDSSSAVRDQSDDADEFDSDRREPVDDIAEELDPDDATVEAWCGADASMAQIFKDCLRENGIACVIVEEGGKHRLMVLPRSSDRAKEIIREVIDAAAPE